MKKILWYNKWKRIKEKRKLNMADKEKRYFFHDFFGYIKIQNSIFITKKLLLSALTFCTMQSSSITSHSFINTSCNSWSNLKNHPSYSLLYNPTSQCLISLMFLCVSSSFKSDSLFAIKMLFFWSTNFCSVTLNIPISFHMGCVLFLYPFLPHSLL